MSRLCRTQFSKSQIPRARSVTEPPGKTYVRTTRKAGGGFVPYPFGRLDQVKVRRKSTVEQDHLPGRSSNIKFVDFLKNSGLLFAAFLLGQDSQNRRPES